MIRPLLLMILLPALAACSAKGPPRIAYDDPQPAHLEPEPPKPVEVVQLPEPLPLPDQLKPVPSDTSKPKPPEPADPVRRVQLANQAARIDPVRDGYINAMQQFPYREAALYEIYVAPLHVTDIALEPGETLTSIGAGDTDPQHWKIGDTDSGAGATRQVHVLVKPVSADLPMNNIVIATDRRTYHLETRPTRDTYMAAVSWRYPGDDLLALRKRNEAGEAKQAEIAATGVDLASLRFRYAISGDDPPWRPVEAFDDGAKVYIRFPAGIAEGEMPPLFLVGPDGDKAELVNYRIRGATMIVDRLFAAAELRFGADPQQIVRIVRTDGKPS